MVNTPFFSAKVLLSSLNSLRKYRFLWKKIHETHFSLILSCRYLLGLLEKTEQNRTELNWKPNNTQSCFGSVVHWSVALTTNFLNIFFFYSFSLMSNFTSDFLTFWWDFCITTFFFHHHFFFQIFCFFFSRFFLSSVFIPFFWWFFF